jgi:hypothetical protein
MRATAIPAESHEDVEPDRQAAADARHHGIAEIGADHEEPAMGEVQDVQDAEDQRQAGRDQEGRHPP